MYDPFNGAYTSDFQLHSDDGNVAVTASPASNGRLGIINIAGSIAIIYTLETQEVRESNQILYPAHTEVGMILLYNDIDVARLESL